MTLADMSKAFDTARFLIGPVGKIDDDPNDRILNELMFKVTTLAHDLSEVQKISLDSAYKLLVGIVDKFDEVSIVRRKEEHGKTPKSTYAIRSAILLASQQEGVGIESWMVYTKGGKPGQDLWSFLDNWKNWVPEAQGSMAKFSEIVHIKALKLARSKPDAKVFLLKGGFGAGKTRLTKKIFSNTAPGVLSPDGGKGVIRRPMSTVTHSKAHVQGSQIAFALFNELIKKMAGTVVYDSSLSRPDDMESYLQKSIKAGKQMEVHDVARHDMARFLSILNRDVEGSEPRIPLGSIIWSAVLDKTKRAECMNIILKHKPKEGSPIPEYHFYGGDERGWNTEEIMVIMPNKLEFTRPQLIEDNERRLALEGIVVNSDGTIVSTIDEHSLRDYYNRQLEKPVSEILLDLSEEEREILTGVFSQRRLYLNDSTVITDVSSLYLQLPDRFRNSISETEFVKAFDSLKEATKAAFFEKIKDFQQINYLDLPLGAALSIHQCLKTDPWK